MLSEVGEESRNDSNNRRQSMIGIDELLELMKEKSLEPSQKRRKKPTNNSTVTKINSQPVDNLAGVFHCFICMEILVDAHICPSCSKLCCFSCIKQWLTLESSCPHCRAYLIIDEFVKCRWAADVTKEIKLLQNCTSQEECDDADDEREEDDGDEDDKRSVNHPTEERCHIHPESCLTVLCCTCMKAICHECALFGEEHPDHYFKQLSDVYKKCVKDIHQHIKPLEMNIVMKNLHIQGLSETETDLSLMKMEYSSQLEDDVNHLREEIEHDYKERVSDLRNYIAMKRVEMDNYYKAKFIGDIALSKMTRTELLSYYRMIINVIDKPSAIKETKKARDFLNWYRPSKIIPQIEMKTLKIKKDYDISLKRCTWFGTSTFEVDGIVWKLKCHINSLGSHISVYFQLVSTPNNKRIDENNYELFLQLYRPTTSDHDMTNDQFTKRFAPSFEIGEQKGYAEFISMIELMSGNYFDSNNYFTLKFGIRAKNYYVKCKQQQLCINELMSRSKLFTEISTNQLTRSLSNIENNEENNRSSSENLPVRTTLREEVNDNNNANYPKIARTSFSDTSINVNKSSDTVIVTPPALSPLPIPSTNSEIVEPNELTNIIGKMRIPSSPKIITLPVKEEQSKNEIEVNDSNEYQWSQEQPLSLGWIDLSIDDEQFPSDTKDKSTKFEKKSEISSGSDLEIFIEKMKAKYLSTTSFTTTTTSDDQRLLFTYGTALTTSNSQTKLTSSSNRNYFNSTYENNDLIHENEKRNSLDDQNLNNTNNNNNNNNNNVHSLDNRSKCLNLTSANISFSDCSSSNNSTISLNNEEQKNRLDDISRLKPTRNLIDSYAKRRPRFHIANNNKKKKKKVLLLELEVLSGYENHGAEIAQSDSEDNSTSSNSSTNDNDINDDSFHMRDVYSRSTSEDDEEEEEEDDDDDDDDDDDEDDEDEEDNQED
ncbi:hypothetical protein SNEBB_009065 [Seison nebaliae]|nr:hypothetical protein SNEBB_009065 [Seison nebaliae]